MIAIASTDGRGILRQSNFLMRGLMKLGEFLMLGVVAIVFGMLRLLGPERSAALGGWITRTFGPLLPVHRTALANIRAAYPEKSDVEVHEIASGAWDNLGRTAAEYPHLSKLFDWDASKPDAPSRTEVVGIEYFEALREDGKPGLIFSAHLANWELPAVCAARYGLDVTAVFRAPNNPAVNRVIHAIRSEVMGGLQAAQQGGAFTMHAALERGAHLGMLIDQHFTRGVPVTFFGRRAMTNPIMAKFAAHIDCPVHGVRVIRLPGRRFRLELTPPLALPRNSDGVVSVADAMQAMTEVVEGWVRENPEQWLWMHRRWRGQ